jgi:hypothetical protein
MTNETVPWDDEVKEPLPCPQCEAATEHWFSYCAMCGYHIAGGLAVSHPVEHIATIQGVKFGHGMIPLDERPTSSLSRPHLSTPETIICRLHQKCRFPTI